MPGNTIFRQNEPRVKNDSVHMTVNSDQPSHIRPELNLRAPTIKISTQGFDQTDKKIRKNIHNISEPSVLTIKSSGSSSHVNRQNIIGSPKIRLRGTINNVSNQKIEGSRFSEESQSNTNIQGSSAGQPLIHHVEDDSSPESEGKHDVQGSNIGQPLIHHVEDGSSPESGGIPGIRASCADPPTDSHQGYVEDGIPLPLPETSVNLAFQEKSGKILVLLNEKDERFSEFERKLGIRIQACNNNLAMLIEKENFLTHNIQEFERGSALSEKKIFQTQLTKKQKLGTEIQHINAEKINVLKSKSNIETSFLELEAKKIELQNDLIEVSAKKEE